MSDTDHPAGSNGTPTWWPPADTPPTNVLSMPDRPTPADRPPGPPAPPPPPAPPTPLEPPAPPRLDAVPQSTDVVASDAVPGRMPTDRIKRVGAGAQRHRRWIALAGGVIVVLAGLNWWASGLAKSVGNGVSEPLTEHNVAIDNMVAGIVASKSAPSQVSVAQPLSWLNCPVTSDAGTMIGYDPNTQYATLDPNRASTVETQVRAFVVQNPLASLRLTATDATTLTVMVGGTKGVPLVDCTGASSTPARQDPSKQGGDTATTAAPR